MKVLVGKCFGLGNAVMAIPMLRAIRSLPQVTRLDLLIGSLPDDGGAFEVFKHLKGDVVDHIYRDSAIDGDHGWYDVAIMSMPFDGRWRGGQHFIAKTVLDGKPRPDPSTTGLSSWKKHEIEYQLESAAKLGWSGEIPEPVFYPKGSPGFIGDIYFGVGYKKDAAGFWKQKHWGNENFAALATLILDEFSDSCIHSTGDILDWKMTLQPIEQQVNNPRFVADPSTLDKAFEVLSRCGMYIGNDTGMMHVAASMGIPCISYFGMENSKVKAAPWGEDHIILEEATPQEVFEIVKTRINQRC